jgi:hypothetical protein
MHYRRVLLALVMMVACGLHAQVAPAVRLADRSAPDGAKCGSTVILRCASEAQRASVAAGAANAAPEGIAAQWQTKRWTGPLGLDEIVITGDRIPEASVREVFERNLGRRVIRRGDFVSSDWGAGRHCTTYLSSGATYCSPLDPPKVFTFEYAP